MISAEDIKAYAEDGVVCVRGLLDADWVARMIAAIDRVEDNPGPFRERYAPDEPGMFFSEKFMWTFDADFRALAFESPAAEVAGALMAATKINLFYDHLMVKEPGAVAPTPWHQDMNYWPAEGDQICSMWMAFDEVGLDNGGMEFVRASHRTGQRYQFVDFRGEDASEESEFAPLPDIESDRDAYDIVAWDLQPGDALVFHGLTLHSARANATAEHRRRALSVRWTGEDMRYIHRRKMIKLIRDPGLSPGDPLDSDLFPVVWTQSDNAA